VLRIRISIARLLAFLVLLAIGCFILPASLLRAIPSVSGVPATPVAAVKPADAVFRRLVVPRID